VRRRSPRANVLFGMVAIGAMGAFRLPPVDNLLRALPVLDVTDNRRLTLWVAFGLTVLGGIGLDHLGETVRLALGWVVLAIVGAMSMGSLAFAVRAFEPAIRARAFAHYERVAEDTAGADPATYRHRAERQVRRALDVLPRTYGLAAAELGILAAVMVFLRRVRRCPAWAPPVVLAMTLVDLGLFGFGLNPAIRPGLQDREPPVIGRLREGLPPEGRALGVGEELPPGVLMRSGLSDPRNYDSVELARSLAWFEPIYEPNGPGQTSRSPVTWQSAIRGLDRLRDAGVGAIVAATPPPAGTFRCVEQSGRVWIAWLDARPWAESGAKADRVEWCRGQGEAVIRLRADSAGCITVRETWDPGWTARIDGRPLTVVPGAGPFLTLQVPKGEHQIILRYDPPEVRIGVLISACAVAAVILILTRNRPFWIPGIT
jgi:Bacterial membrane protein YfhO